MTTLQKLPKNNGDLGKLIGAKCFKNLPKYKKSPNLVTLFISKTACHLDLSSYSSLSTKEQHAFSLKRNHQYTRFLTVVVLLFNAREECGTACLMVILGTSFTISWVQLTLTILLYIIIGEGLKPE